MRTVIFIAGMGRSGTSALARLLSLQGAVLPARLVAPNRSNPAGHWEPLAALRINEAFLRAHRSSWFDPGLRLQLDSAIGANGGERLVEKAAAFLVGEDVADGQCLIVKEPRIPALFPFWFQAAERAGFVCKVVFIYRHPAEVAASLRARNLLEKDHAYLLWLKHNLLSERYSRDRPRAFMTFASLIEAPDEALAAALETLRIDLPTARNRDARAFIALGLRHHVEEGPVSDDPTPRLWIARTCDLLHRALAGGSCDEGFDRIYHEYADWILEADGLRPRARRWRIRLAHFAHRQPSPRAWRCPIEGAGPQIDRRNE